VRVYFHASAALHPKKKRLVTSLNTKVGGPERGHVDGKKGVVTEDFNGVKNSAADLPVV